MSLGVHAIGRSAARLPDGLRKVALSLPARSAAAVLRFLSERSTKYMARLGGIEPPHPAPEAGALSPELQAPFFDSSAARSPPEGPAGRASSFAKWGE